MKTTPLLSLLLVAIALVAAFVAFAPENGSDVGSVVAHGPSGKAPDAPIPASPAVRAPSLLGDAREVTPTTDSLAPADEEEARVLEASEPGTPVEVLVVTRSGAPVPGATVQVSLRRQGVRDDRTTTEEHVSDSSGRVVFTAARPLTTGALSASLVAWKDELFGEHTIAALDPDEVRTHEVVLDPTVVVQGLVTDKHSGAPVTGAEVRISTLDRDVGTSTDSSGRYTLRFPAQGRGHAISFRSPTHGEESVQIVANPDGLCLLQFPEPESLDWSASPMEVDVQLPRALTLLGTVTDAGGTPIPGASVTANGYYAMAAGIGFPDTASAVTDGSGEFALEGLRSDIGHQLVVTHDGMATLSHEVPADVTGHRDCGRLVLSEALPLVGAVVDQLGLPVQGLEVRVMARAPRNVLSETSADSEPSRDTGLRMGLSRRTLTSRDGTFAIDQLPAGDYSVHVSELRRRVLEADVTLDAGTSARGLELQIPSTEGTLEGRVVRQSQPVPDATVVLSHKGWKRFAQADAHGRFRLCAVRLEAAYDLQAFVLDADGGILEQSATHEVWAFAPEVELRLE